MSFDVSFAEADRIAAAREKKKYELIERLSKLYVKHLDFDELVFARAYSYGHCLQRGIRASTDRT